MPSKIKSNSQPSTASPALNHVPKCHTYSPRDGDSTTSLSSLNPLMSKFFPIANINLPWHNWSMFSLVLLLTWEKRPIPTFFQVLVETSNMSPVPSFHQCKRPRITQLLSAILANLWQTKFTDQLVSTLLQHPHTGWLVLCKRHHHEYNFQKKNVNGMGEGNS